MVQGPVIIYSSHIKQTDYHLSPKVQKFEESYKHKQLNKVKQAILTSHKGHN